MQDPLLTDVSSTTQLLTGFSYNCSITWFFEDKNTFTNIKLRLGETHDVAVTFLRSVSNSTADTYYPIKTYGDEDHFIATGHFSIIFKESQSSIKWVVTETKDRVVAQNHEQDGFDFINLAVPSQQFYCTESSRIVFQFTQPHHVQTVIDRDISHVKWAHHITSNGLEGAPTWLFDMNKGEGSVTVEGNVEQAHDHVLWLNKKLMMESRPPIRAVSPTRGYLRHNHLLNASWMEGPRVICGASTIRNLHSVDIMTPTVPDRESSLRHDSDDDIPELVDDFSYYIWELSRG